MELLRAVRFRLRPTADQATLFRRTAGVCRAVYNAGLVQRSLLWSQHRVRVRYEAQSEELKELKAAFPWVSEAPHHCLQQTLKNLDRAFQSFFAGTTEYPRAKRKGQSRDSFRFPEPKHIAVSARGIKLPKAGWVHLCASRRQRLVASEIRSATVSFEHGHWYVSVLCRSEVAEPAAPQGPFVGIDLGVANAVTTSGGEVFQVPVLSARDMARLAYLQQQVSKKRRGSRNQAKARQRVARFHARHRRRREDVLHKITRRLAKTHGRIAIEDLKVKTMTRSARGTPQAPGRRVRQKAGLNRAILQRCWGEFRRQLEYKCQEEGSTLLLAAPHGTSITCRICGHRDAGNRPAQAVFRCISCGHTEHADVHAAKNILAAGVAVTKPGELPARKAERRTRKGIPPL